MTEPFRIDDPAAAGRPLGRFELHRLLGRGGGGAVWRAHDRELGRDVAVKVAKVQSDAVRSRQRFQREIRALAALNHPGVAQVYEAGTASWPLHPEVEVAFLVMEYVPGETLSQRLSRGPIEVAEAVEVVCALLEGLAAAHDRMIAHRDIKPSNVMLTGDGGVKLLDLGLAKVQTWDQPDPLAEADGVQTIVDGPLGDELPLTEHGKVLGTPGYMAPEQARGGAADLRSDIFAVGLLLWELLTGRRAVRARTPVESLQATIDFEARPEDLPASIPAPLRRVVLRCLARRSSDRYHHARDLLYDLRRSLEPALEVESRPGNRWPAATGALLLLALTLVAGLWLWRGPTGTTEPPRAGIEELEVPWNAPVLVPDGEGVVFKTRDGDSIWFGALESGVERQIWNGDGIVESMAITPSGRDVVFELREASGQRAVWEVPFSGGAARRITTGWGPAVSPNGTTLALFDADEKGSSVFVCGRDGTEKRAVARLEGPLAPVGLVFSEDGRRLWLVRSDTYHLTQVHEVEITTGAIRLVRELEGWVRAGLWRTPDGRLLLSKVTTEAHSILAVLGEDGLDPVLPGASYYTSPSMSRDGSLLTLQSNRERINLVRVPIDLTGARPATDGPRLGPPGNSNQPRLAPSGERLAFARRRGHIWILDLESGAARPLVTMGDTAVNPAWSRDGERLAFSVLKEGASDLWLVEGDGTGPVPLLDDPANDFHPDWHPDGDHLFWISDRDGQEDLYRLHVGDGEVVRLSRAGALNPSISAQGDLVAFVRRSSGRRCQLLVYQLTPELDLGDLRWTTEEECGYWGGLRPRFARSGLWLAYDRPQAEGADLWAVDLSVPGEPEPVRLTQFDQPVGLAGWFDWEGMDGMIVSVLRREESLLLLRDARLWIQAASSRWRR